MFGKISRQPVLLPQIMSIVVDYTDQDPFVRARILMLIGLPGNAYTQVLWRMDRMGVELDNVTPAHIVRIDSPELLRYVIDTHEPKRQYGVLKKIFKIAAKNPGCIVQTIIDLLVMIQPVFGERPDDSEIHKRLFDDCLRDHEELDQAYAILRVYPQVAGTVTPGVWPIFFGSYATLEGVFT